MDWFPVATFVWRWREPFEKMLSAHASKGGVDPIVIVDEYFDAIVPLTKRYHPEWGAFLDDLRNTMHAVLGK